MLGRQRVDVNGETDGEWRKLGEWGIKNLRRRV
jgi:hypothetical protein